MEPVEFRRRLHAHPELSFKEHDTAAFIEQQLDELGIEHRRIASTGVVARIKGRKTPEGDRRAAVLRADIDALPVTERNDYSSITQPLARDIDHHVPYIVFRDIIIVDDHHIADHRVIFIDTEGLALLPVNIRLGEAADRV